MKKNKLGLVLSGGGTKGIAHAGVLQFLREHQIRPDILSCCSAGSIVGCLYAVGKSPEEILDFFKSIYFFNWRHFTFNEPGLVSSKIFRNYLTPVFDNMTIGDLNTNIRIVATELVEGKQEVFKENFKVIDAIIASCSIPGVTTPYIIGEKLYSDGGVLNSFPADVIREDCKKMIGVFVSPPQDIELADLNSIKAVVSRSYDLLSYRTEFHKFSYCDWFITSQKLAHYGTFERKPERLDEIFEIGYEAAKNSFSEDVIYC